MGLDLLLGNMDMVVTIVGGLVTALLGFFVKNALTRSKTEKIIHLGIVVAAHVVDEVSKRTSNTLDDKIALGLKKFVEYTNAHNVQPTEKQVDEAKNVIRDLHLKSLESK